MHHMVMAPVMFGQFVDLGMAVMTASDYVCCPGLFDLVVLDAAVCQTFILETVLEKSTAAAATEIVGPVRVHVNEVLFADNGFNDIPEIFSRCVSVGFPDDLAGILNRKLDLKVFVPIGIGLQFSFTDPLCIIVIDVFNFKVVFDVIFFQSCQDCEGYVPSFGVQVGWTTQFMAFVRGFLDDVLPSFVIGKEHAVVFTGPAFASVGPVRTDKVQDFP